MSLLISRDYANSAKPLWLSSTGGTITGNLTVDGTITATSDIISETEVDAPSLRVIDGNGASTMILANDGTFSLVQSTDAIKFTQLGTPNGNTTLTLSVAGANTDNLSVGGTMNCLIGPVPTQLITSAKPIAGIPVSPSAPYVFPVDNTVTGINGAEYDVQVTGIVSCASGVPLAGDSVVFNFTAGTFATVGAVVYPAETGAAIGNYGVGGAGPLTAGGAGVTINMRFRCSPTASGTNLNCNVRTFLAGGSTAVYSASLTLFDVQRVR